MGLLLLFGGASFSGALDTLGTGLESAWSVGRRLRSAYTGPIIRVRRSSDNAEQDFSGSGTTGAVDAAAVAAFCGAGDGFLATIYGQSGLSRNLTQSTTTLQPTIVSSGVALTRNGRLVCRGTAASPRRMAVASSTALYNFLHTTGGTLYSVFQSNDTAVRKPVFGTCSSLSAQAGILLLSGSSEVVELRTARIDVAGVATAGNSIAIGTTGTATLDLRLASAFVDPDNGTAANRVSIWHNTTLAGGTNSSTGTPFVENAGGNLTILDYPAGSTPYDGDFGELVIWSGDQTANRTTWESSAKTFWGTP